MTGLKFKLSSKFVTLRFKFCFNIFRYVECYFLIALYCGRDRDLQIKYFSFFFFFFLFVRKQCYWLCDVLKAASIVKYLILILKSFLPEFFIKT